MIVQQVIQRLDSHRYLNDEEFAKAYVLTQVNTTSKGPSVIKRELQEKGIKPDIVQSTLEHFSKEEQIETVMKLMQS